MGGGGAVSSMFLTVIGNNQQSVKELIHDLFELKQI